MTEYQKIAAGLLEMTHPEIVLHQRRVQAQQEAEVEVESEAEARAPWPFVTRAQAAVGAFKFAVAAFVAGSRTVPMGDNGCVMHDLNAYGARQRMDANCP
jgi:hypothetical protein